MTRHQMESDTIPTAESGLSPAATEAPARLMLDVTGLCALWTGDSGTGKEEPMNVLMLRGTHGASHRPVLTFNMRHFVSLSSGSELKKLEVVQLPDGEQYGSWELARKIVSLVHMPGAEPAGVRLLGDKDLPGEEPESPTDEYALHWLPSMARASEQNDPKVCAHFLGDNPEVPSDGGSMVDQRILARFDVPQGYCYASAQVNELREPDVWDFVDGERVTTTQFIAETARCEVRHLPSAQIQIVSHPFGKPGAKETLILKAWDDAIRMTLTNLPDVDRLLPGDFSHFAAYYEILDPRPARKPRPVKKARPSSPPPPGSGSGSGGRVSPRGTRPVMCSPCCIP